MPLSLADVLSAQAGSPGPTYEGGPDANVTPGGVLSALGLGGPSWLEAAKKQGEADWANYQRGGVPAMFENTQGAQDLAGGFGGGAIAGPIKAYHGSPYDFAKFDLSKIGTGEGAQSYGHGLYFAENPAVALDYKTKLAGQDLTGATKHFLDLAGGDTTKALQLVNDRLAGGNDSYLTAIKAQLESHSPGKMYEVNINAEPGQFLNWDAPLSQQSPILDALRSSRDKAVKDAMSSDLAQNLGPRQIYGRDVDPVSGKDLYNLLSLNKSGKVVGPEITPVLSKAGIPGIRYLDQGSRTTSGGQLLGVEQTPQGWQAKIKVGNRGGVGFQDPTDIFTTSAPQATEQAARDWANAQINKGTSNYVVFNPDIVDILKKYGLAGLTMGGVLSAAGQPPQSQ